MSRAQTSLSIKPMGPLAAALTQLFQAPQNDIRGVETSDWFGPLQPVRPIAPEGTQPRGIQFPPGQNLIFTPRANEPLKAGQLREASMYDMVRVIIENVKDQVCRMPVNIRLRRRPGETSKEYAKRKPDQKILQDLTALIEFPNPEQNRSEFTRKIMDDMLIIDAASVLMRTTSSGKLIELRAIDGATITRYIDEQGYTPLPPSPAYAQLWYGIPMVNLTTEQLIYAPRNVPTYRLYGMSPVEQAIHWIAVGSKRLDSQLQFYTAGTIPDALQIVPPGVPVDLIAEAQAWMVSDLAGDLAKKRQLRMIQGFAPEGKDQILFPKEAMLSDPFDDLVIRCLCFAFGQSPQRLMRMMNRATSESADTSAEKEGLEPWLDWLCGAIWNRIIQQKLGFFDYEAAFEEQTDVDPLKQAQINEIKLRTGEHTINENREDDGLDPRPEAEADMLLIITATGAIPVSADEEVKRAKAKADAMPPPAPGGFGGGKPPDDSQKKTLKFVKGGKFTIDPSQLTVQSSAAKGAIHHTLTKLFAKQQLHATRKAKHLVKAEKTPAEVADEIYKAIAAEYASVVDDITASLNDAGRSGVHHGATVAGITDTAMIDEANTVAQTYANDRGAELVGMRRQADGTLVENPNAEWAISSSTRDEIRTIVRDAFDTDTPLQTIIDKIRDAGAFSDSRATMIAKTEVQFAQSGGNFEVWKAANVVTKLKWILSADHTQECICEDNEDVEVEFGHLFPSGNLYPPAHPRCECVVVATGFTE